MTGLNLDTASVSLMPHMMLVSMFLVMLCSDAIGCGESVLFCSADDRPLDARSPAL